MWLAAIFLVTTISYSPVFKAGFVNWDDEVYVLNNEYVHELSSSNIKHMFSEPIGGIYQPLTMLSLAIDYSISGDEAKWFHIHNVLLHLINTLLVFFVARRLFSKNNVGLLVAAMFGLHTLHVESVAWVTERKDVLYTLFYLLSLLQYLKFISERKMKLLGFTLLFFLLAVLAKPAAVVLAGVFPLVDWYKGRKLFSKQVILEKLPFLLLGILFGLKLVSDQVDIDAVNYMDNQGLGRHSVFAGYSFAMYLFKTVLPINLSTVYPIPAQPGDAIGAVIWFVTLVGSGGFLAALWFFRKLKWVVFGLLFFAGNVVLMLQWVPVGYAYQADRFTYVASIGLFAIIAVAIARIMEKKPNYLAGGIFTVWLISLSIMTNTQAKVWENSITLWTDVISKYDNIYIPYSNRGYFLKEIGNFGAALQDFNKCIEIKETAQVYLNRGNVHAITGNYELALLDLTRSIELDSAFADAYIDRGVVLMQLEKDEEAISDFNIALELAPDHLLACTNKGSALYNLKRYEEAIEPLSQALKIGGNNPSTLLFRGLSYFAIGEDEKAITDFDLVLMQQPDNSLALNSRGGALRSLGRLDEAILSLNNSLAIDPYNPNTLNIRGLCHAESGNIEVACSDFEYALSLGLLKAHDNIEKYCPHADSTTNHLH